MPPKKQEEEPSAPSIVWSIFPVIVNSTSALQALKKPVNIKKALDKPKLIQLLKEKGIQKYISEGTLTREGELFLCQNLQSAGQQFLASLKRPVDPKKDQKKDTKKDSKKQETVVEQAQKPLQFDFQKGVTEFLFFLETPSDSQALQVAVKSGYKPEIVIWIEQRVKQGSEVPKYDLLNHQRTVQDFLNEINSTSPEKLRNSVLGTELQIQKKKKRETINAFINIRAKNNSELENTIIIQVPFQKDLQHPQQDTTSFLTSLFKKVCEISLQKNKFQTWIKSQKVSPMVPTIKQKIKREVVVEQKKEEKKGGKKDAVSQPVTEIIEEVIERKYESFPENIKSDLKLYNRISRQRKRHEDQSTYHKILQDLAYSISLSTEPRQPWPQFKQLSNQLWQIQKAKPITKVGVQNLKDKLRSVTFSPQSQQMNYKITFQPVSLTNNVTLANFIQHYPHNISLQHQYKLKQFVQLNKMLGKRVFLSFDDRKYVQRLSPVIVNSLINKELEYDPRVFYAKCQKDNYHILILMKVNPPGRILYKNQIFGWKILPNFQFWQQNFHSKEVTSQFWDYNWRETGNLKILNKRMMPNDNCVIVESAYCSGDTVMKLVTIAKDNTLYGLRAVDFGGYLFWKKFQKTTTTVHLSIQQKHAQKKLQICIKEEQYTVLFNPNPNIIWSNNIIEQSRSFGPSGEITRRLKNGSVQIFYPNGDVSTLSFGNWTHIKNNTIYEPKKEPRQLKREKKTDTDKYVQIRQDSTTFVTFPNGDISIIFKDGTIIRKMGTKKINILNPANIIVRVFLKRQKDMNIIGSGSAFAYLGQTNLLQRSYDGSLYQFYDNNFSYHSYTEAVDLNGSITFQNIMLIAYPDASIIKAGSKGQITFLNHTADTAQSCRHQRWIQLFTAPQYHQEGVYNVDLAQGEVKTRDAESNTFRVRVDGTGKAEIAVSFNIGNVKQQKNQFGSGFHVPEQNFFLPTPQNNNPPKLFVIYPDGSADQYLTESQIQDLKAWRAVDASAGNRTFTQYSREIKPSSSYLQHSFTQLVNLELFSLPNLLEQVVIRPKLVKYDYNRVEFRCIQTISWDTSFAKINQAEAAISQKRQKIENELVFLRNRVIQ